MIAQHLTNDDLALLGRVLKAAGFSLLMWNDHNYTEEQFSQLRAIVEKEMGLERVNRLLSDIDKELGR